MTYYDTSSGTWKNVASTCNPPWEQVDYTLQLYSVHLCHLTQFGVFYWQVRRPHFRSAVNLFAAR
jgi:hypothetical protein